MAHLRDRVLEPHQAPKERTHEWEPLVEIYQTKGSSECRWDVPTRSATLQNSSGGHSVVWAEENTRDSIFTALKNKETYGTSGTRIVVRFFGGWEFVDGLCKENYVKAGYDLGVPMGGDLKERGDHRFPSFVVAASMDEYVKTPLQQIQIVKGWVDESGNRPRTRPFAAATRPRRRSSSL